MRIQLVTLAIIGSAGRKSDGAKMNRTIFDHMVKRSSQVIHDVFCLSHSSVVLVSGGSSWADHVAVRLFLDAQDDPFAGLRLHLPAAFSGASFVDTGKPGWRSNPGRVLNDYHGKFSAKARFDSLKDIASVRALGAELISTSTGFHSRNTQVAKSDYMLAFTWNSSACVRGSEPKSDGGTRDTWDKASGVKLHVPLQFVHSVVTQHDLVTAKKWQPSIACMLTKPFTDKLKAPVKETKGVLCPASYLTSLPDERISLVRCSVPSEVIVSLKRKCKESDQEPDTLNSRPVKMTKPSEGEIVIL